MIFVAPIDPAVRKDGLCAAGCGNERPDLARAEGDPFCTSKCCRAFHGIVFLLDTPARYGRMHDGTRRRAA